MVLVANQSFVYYYILRQLQSPDCVRNLLTVKLVSSASHSVRLSLS